EPAEPRHGERDRLLRCVVLGDVDRERRDHVRLRAGRLLQFVELVAPAAHADDANARLYERQCGRKADAGSRTGDERNFQDPTFSMLIASPKGRDAISTSRALAVEPTFSRRCARRRKRCASHSAVKPMAPWI